MIARQEDENHVWLNTNIIPRKMAGIMDMLELIVETRKWKALSNLSKTEFSTGTWQEQPQIYTFKFYKELYIIIKNVNMQVESAINEDGY